MIEVSGLLIAQSSATFVLVGIAWFAQVVFYPSYLDVGAATFQRFETRALGRVVWLITPLMLVEAVASGLLLSALSVPGSAEASAAFQWIGFGSVLVVWVSTIAIQWPLHRQLAHSGWDAGRIRWLVRSQWIRTVAWSVHGGSTIAMLAGLFR